MAIDWNDHKKRKAFREALQETYPSPAELERFVDEELNENLLKIAGGANLQTAAYELIKWAKARGRLDDVYEAFKKENPTNPAIEVLKCQSLIPKLSKFTQEDWDWLFDFFALDDLADLKRAFNQGFQKTLGLAFQQAQPHHPPLTELIHIREWLEYYADGNEGSLFAVRFVECAIRELRRSADGYDRNLASLEQWRDRIAQTHEVVLQTPESVDQSTRQGFLLISLQPSGRQTQKEGASVNLFAELQVAGETSPIKFDACPITCPLKEVANHLSTLIQKAEVALIPYECSEVAIELFLPCCHLEENVAIWQVKNEQERLRLLGTHRRFLVRSFERAANPTKRVAVSQKWQLLKSCMAEGKVYSRFHCQTVCPNPGDLEALLSDKPGLRLLAALPDDLEHRADIFYDIINSAVPIALWCSQTDGCSVDDLEAQFNQLLEDSRLTDFAHLAQQWRSRRVEPENAAVKHIRLLCDCPDRWPSLPSPTQEDDQIGRAHV